MRNSDYPPGVTGNEWQITGEDHDNDWNERYGSYDDIPEPDEDYDRYMDWLCNLEPGDFMNPNYNLWLSLGCPKP